jgi:hypothetical protein
VRPQVHQLSPEFNGLGHAAHGIALLEQDNVMAFLEKYISGGQTGRAGPDYTYLAGGGTEYSTSFAVLS